MTKIEVEKDLRQQLERLIAKYPEVVFKYAYDNNRQVYLVSDIVDVNRDDYEQYCEDIMRVEDELNDRYDFDAPLFTNNERSFSLPFDAIEISSQVKSMVEQFVRSIKISNRRYETQDDSYMLTYNVPQTVMTSVEDEFIVNEYPMAA